MWFTRIRPALALLAVLLLFAVVLVATPAGKDLSPAPFTAADAVWALLTRLFSGVAS
jgi:hypothetical protein